jgi:hypothetical protein
MELQLAWLPVKPVQTAGNCREDFGVLEMYAVVIVNLRSAPTICRAVRVRRVGSAPSPSSGDPPSHPPFPHTPTWWPYFPWEPITTHTTLYTIMLPPDTRILLGQLNPWRLNHCPITLVSNYQHTMCNNPEEQRLLCLSNQEGQQIVSSAITWYKN